MQDRVPTPGQEGRVLITPENGEAFYAKVQMADNPTQEGTPLIKETLLTDGTADFYGLSDDDSIPDKALAIAKGWKLIATLDSTGGFSGTWIAPDVFGDGGAYDLGAYLIGAGGSGAAYATGRTSGSTSGATGGCSGYGKNIVFEQIVPGQQYQYVIGAKGTPVSLNFTGSSYSSGQSGNPGGSTSFGGQVALGGDGGRNFSGSPEYIQSSFINAEGGQPFSQPYASPGGRMEFARVFGCVAANPLSPSQPVREGQNTFDSGMVSLAAGGYAMSTPQTVAAMPDGTKGGSGARLIGNGSITAESATGHGNGGGGVYAQNYTTSGTVTSGAGSDGIIYLYAARRGS